MSKEPVLKKNPIYLDFHVYIYTKDPEKSLYERLITDKIYTGGTHIFKKLCHDEFIRLGWMTKEGVIVEEKKVD